MPRRLTYGAGVPCWIDCITGDLARSTAFYARLFGWEFGREPGDTGRGYAIIRCDGEIIGGMGLLPPGRSGGGFWSTYLASKDIGATVQAVARLGGQVVMPPIRVGGGRLFLAVDPTGAAVGFWQGDTDDGVVLVDEPGAMTWHRLFSADLSLAGRFYGRLLGGVVAVAGRGDGDPDGPSLALTVDGRCYADLVPVGPPLRRAVAPGWVPYFAVTDRESLLERVIRGGGIVLQRARLGGDAVVRDPTGAIFGVRPIDVAA